MATDAVSAVGAGRAHAEERTTLWEYFTWSQDHKVIGVQYGIVALLFFLIAGLVALTIRLELWNPATGDLVSNERFNSLTTLHGSAMLFLFILPMVTAIGNYVVPLQIGAVDMAFPWLNAFAFWLIPPAAFIILVSFFIGAAE